MHWSMWYDMMFFLCHLCSKSQAEQMDKLMLEARTHSADYSARKKAMGMQ